MNSLGRCFATGKLEYANNSRAQHLLNVIGYPQRAEWHNCPVALEVFGLLL